MVSLRDSWALFGFARFVSMRTKLKVNSQKPTVQLVHRISNAMGEVMLFFFAGMIDEIVSLCSAFFMEVIQYHKKSGHRI